MTIDEIKGYLAIAESVDAKREAYFRAATGIVEAFANGTSYSAIARDLGRNESYVRKLAQWVARTGENGVDLPFSEPTGAVGDRHARTALRDPARRREVIDSLPPQERAAIAREVLEDDEVVDEVVRTAPGTAQRVGARVAARPHPSREPNPLPGGVPEPEVGFRMAMAGPLSRLADAVEDVVRGWEAGAEDAREIEREGVQDTIARHSARLAALITSMEVPS